MVYGADDLPPPPPMPDDLEEAMVLAEKIKRRLLTPRGETWRRPLLGYGLPEYRPPMQVLYPLEDRYVSVQYEKGDVRLFISGRTSAACEAFAQSLVILRTGLPITSVTFVEEEQWLSCKLRMTVRHRETWDACQLHSQHHFPWQQLEGGSSPNEMLLYGLRGLIYEALNHEFHESLLVGGVRVLDPHRGEP
jgi:hypothetical protein